MTGGTTYEPEFWGVDAKYCLNRCVFNARLNVDVKLMWRMSDGREFH